MMMTAPKLKKAITKRPAMSRHRRAAHLRTHRQTIRHQRPIPELSVHQAEMASSAAIEPETGAETGFPPRLYDVAVMKWFDEDAPWWRALYFRAFLHPVLRFSCSIMGIGCPSGIEKRADGSWRVEFLEGIAIATERWIA